MRAHQQGFSLAEIAIALLIIALLLGGSLQASSQDGARFLLDLPVTAPG